MALPHDTLFRKMDVGKILLGLFSDLCNAKGPRLAKDDDMPYGSQWLLEMAIGAVERIVKDAKAGGMSDMVKRSVDDYINECDDSRLSQTDGARLQRISQQTRSDIHELVLVCGQITKFMEVDTMLTMMKAAV